MTTELEVLQEILIAIKELDANTRKRNKKKISEEQFSQAAS